MTLRFRVQGASKNHLSAVVTKVFTKDLWGLPYDHADAYRITHAWREPSYSDYDGQVFYLVTTHDAEWAAKVLANPSGIREFPNPKAYHIRLAGVEVSDDSFGNIFRMLFRMS